jgi:cytochrome c oxidase subunit 2
VLIAMEDTSDSELTIKVTGYQWKWHYQYLGSDVDFFSTLADEHNQARQLNSGADLSKIDNYLREVDNPLVIPTGVKIRFLHTANDVIHSWWVPALSLKKDAIPGFINENWTIVDKPGVYRGKCAELCGRDHGFMPIVVKAVPPEEFARWLESQTQTKAASLNNVKSKSSASQQIALNKGGES